MSVIYSTLQYPLVPKTPKAPTMQQVLFPQDEIHCTFNSRSPRSSNMNYHTTAPEILETLIISLVLIPEKKTCKTSRPLFNILGAAEVQALGFS